MKVRKKGRNRYIKMQEGGLGAFAARLDIGGEEEEECLGC